ncbi:DNA topoisomerase VI subunit B [Bdellovibrio svalbardensis]|uniref:Type 2 DNA topoisomerase 6 subunit B n=1 Tax=Bdellovibrio svalbardensis TaxID=2972972 RepID=A0ABT6DMK2_9BACT|nr:DNA topoisomerase VI subunit B [Bdellovibrio svalbardensis]MDG0818095.1 DNA topoisomerase VI subunit B [Bdellovibrio svalbardensis]
MSKITKSSTAEYFAKNLQQVGFSSPLKAVLTTLKEAVDNSLDACESAAILPDLLIEVTKVGTGSTKNTDLIRIVVEDNGPGIEADDLAKVYGEYLASSKFGRGQCSRGQQGIGISAATTWAQMTNARGVNVTSKTKKMRKAMSAQVDVDIKSNTGILKNKETIDWDREHGTRVEFLLDGRIQLNGDGGILTYIEGTVLVNPHLTVTYKLMENDFVTVNRVTTEVPEVPEATLPHPHTFKLGEFITHSTLFGKTTLSKFLKTGFSRISDQSIKDFTKNGLPKNLLERPVSSLSDEDFKKAFMAVQATTLMAPSTKSVLTVGEESLAKSIYRLGEVDFFAVVTRKPTICDFKPVVVEVALARFKDRNQQGDTPVQLLRFANRVPLQFDKSGCAITWAIESVNWKSYGLQQPKDSLPLGPYIFAVSIVSPFIKFKNASKETIDASEELVAEIRLALIQAGQKLSRHIKKEVKEADLERKLAHIEQFGPILVEGLARLVNANEARKNRATEGLKKLLGRDSEDAIADLEAAESKLLEQKKRDKKKGIEHDDIEEDVIRASDLVDEEESEAPQGTTKKATTKKATTTTKKTTGKKR